MKKAEKPLMLKIRRWEVGKIRNKSWDAWMLARQDAEDKTKARMLGSWDALS